MKTMFLFIIGFSLLISCREQKQEESSEALSENADLLSEIAQLKHENALKDSVINEALSFYNEIQRNLESIGAKRDIISSQTNDPEMSQFDKEYILSEIRHINFLREENAKKVNQLNDKVKESGLKLNELEQMVNKLLSDIQAKDEQIVLLQESLDNLDKEYSRLFDAYQEQIFVADNLKTELNTAYYTYGTLKELTSNQVLEQKNGFIGIGKKTTVSSKLNQNYFTKIDITQKDNILIEGLQIRLMTDHPENTYRIEQQGNNSKIIITSPREFWKISKFLIVVVE